VNQAPDGDDTHHLQVGGAEPNLLPSFRILN